MATSQARRKAPKPKTAAENLEANAEALAGPEGNGHAPVAPILDLNTINPDRTTILVDKEPYELHLMGDYGIAEQHALTKEWAEFDELWEKDPKDLNKAEGGRLGLILDRMIRKALMAPAGVVARLNDEQRRQVVQVFMSASAQSLQRALVRAAEAMMEARESSTSES